MKVSIGRIVLIANVVDGERTFRPAIVVVAHDNDTQAVDVQMFLDGSYNALLRFLSEVPHESAADADPSQDVFWIWPPRES